VMTCNVPGAFMQVDVNEVVHARLVGPVAELLTEVDPTSHTQHMAHYPPPCFFKRPVWTPAQRLFRGQSVR
jgi:hypothetical protein